MYKVILVDDEKQITDGLSKMIRWPELGYEVVATARNGVEAIPLIQSLKPDLVVTDVRMPEMDGLKMLEMVRKHISQDVEFIILSGYSDFQYARTAMQYNVKSYILKPIDESELYGALLDIMALLNEKEIRKSLKIRSCLNGFLLGDQPETAEVFPREEEQLGIRYLVVQRHEQYDSLTAGGPQEGRPDLFQAIAGLYRDPMMRFVLRQDRDHCHIVVGKSLLLGHGNNPRQLARALQDHLAASAGIGTDILVGRLVTGVRELHQSVQSIYHCRNKLFYLPSPSIVLYEDIREEGFSKVYEDNGLVIKVIAAFRKNDMERLGACIGQMVEHFTKLQVVPEIAMVHLDSAMASILQILAESHEVVDSVLERYAFFKKIQSHVGIHNLARLALQFCQACNDLSLASKKIEHGDIVARVARYVEENYAQPLRINDIAERFFVNPAYLGQQFARKRGFSLNHYINSVRIEKAKELLATTPRRVYEIAAMAGFDDPNYFSSKFLEYTGCTPSEFRCRTEGPAPKQPY